MKFLHSKTVIYLGGIQYSSKVIYYANVDQNLSETISYRSHLKYINLIPFRTKIVINPLDTLGSAIRLRK